MAIVFGTDGWRAKVPEEGGDFSEENVRKVIRALAEYWRREKFEGGPAIVGYDRRRDSKAMAKVVAEVLVQNGVDAALATSFCPTPTVAWMSKARKAKGAVMVTASHNPWQWNGIKFKEPYGGAASPAYTDQVEALIREGLPSTSEKPSPGTLSSFDPHREYLDQLRHLIDIPLIQKSGIKVLHDPMYGAGCGYLKALLGDLVTEIHAGEDFRFGNTNPEPIEANLKKLSEGVKDGGYALGVANDGDADRIGAVDERGHYITSHQLFSLLFKYLVEKRGLRGPVVKSLSTTQMLNRMGAKYGLPIYETPVGFKYICQKFVEMKALLGGEESGGIGFGPHVYERDGVLNALFLMEIVASYGKPLSQLIADLDREFGPLFYQRLDLHLEASSIEKARAAIKKPAPESLAGFKVVSASTIDGLKFGFESGAWLLIRLSGTEPLARIYSEAPSEREVKLLLEAGRALLT